MGSKRIIKKHNKEIGNLGEDMARNYLIQEGYSILDLNYRCPKGELDIVAKDNDTIVFIEVKTRTNSKFGQPFEAVDNRKLQRLYTVAQFYIYEKKLKECKYRFDIVSIIFKNQLPKFINKDHNTIYNPDYDKIHDQKSNTDFTISLIKNVII